MKHLIEKTSENIKEIERIESLILSNENFGGGQQMLIDLLLKEVKLLRHELRYVEELAIKYPMED